MKETKDVQQKDYSKVFSTPFDEVTVDSEESQQYQVNSDQQRNNNQNDPIQNDHQPKLKHYTIFRWYNLRFFLYLSLTLVFFIPPIYSGPIACILVLYSSIAFCLGRGDNNREPKNCVKEPYDFFSMLFAALFAIIYGYFFVIFALIAMTVLVRKLQAQETTVDLAWAESWFALFVYWMLCFIFLFEIRNFCSLWKKRPNDQQE